MKIDELLSEDIIALEPTARTYNCLKRAGVNTIRELTEKSIEDLQRVRNMGRKCVEEVEELLGAFGLELRKE